MKDRKKFYEILQNIQVFLQKKQKKLLTSGKKDYQFEIFLIYQVFSQLDLNINGPFVALPDGRLKVDSQGMRISRDDGKTWSSPHPVCSGISGNEPASHYIVRTKKGTLVMVYLDFTTYNFSWDDEGRMWKRSNFIDIGGHGHHDGATEPTVAEPSDGRLFMLIRTNLDRFWQAISEDDGKSWTRPVVIAQQKGGQLSYPYLFERRPGELWVIPGSAFRKGWEDPLLLQIKLNEEKFLCFVR